jgi:hypothetical protein
MISGFSSTTEPIASAAPISAPSAHRCVTASDRIVIVSIPYVFVLFPCVPLYQEK